MNSWRAATVIGTTLDQDEDFLEGEGTPTSSLLRWNLKIQPGKPKPQSGQFLKFREFSAPGDSQNSQGFRQKVLKFPEFSGFPCKALPSSQMDRKRRRGIRQGGRRAKIGVEPVAFYGDIFSFRDYLDPPHTSYFHISMALKSNMA